MYRLMCDETVHSIYRGVMHGYVISTEINCRIDVKYRRCSLSENSAGILFWFIIISAFPEYLRYRR